MERNGNNHRFTLCSHSNNHSEDKNETIRASYFVQYKLPNEHTMVGHLIKSITSKDPIIISGITHIQGIVDQRNDFKSGADSLLLTA